jgi:hypothetical protein
MSKFGRLEAQITVPTGGWAVALTVTAIGGPTTVTLPAGTYWISDLLSTFTGLLNAAFGGDGAFSYSANFDEGADGLVAFQHTVETFSWTWTSTNFRDLLGFTANLTPAASSFSGTEVCEAIWRPDNPFDAPRGTTTGIRKFDRTLQVSPQGDQEALAYQNKRTVGTIRFPIVGKARTLRAQESVTNESFETWFENTHGGLVTYFGAAPKCRWYWDANLATKIEFKLTKPVDTFMPERVDPNWIGLWAWEIDGNVVPGT